MCYNFNIFNCKNKLEFNKVKQDTNCCRSSGQEAGTCSWKGFQEEAESQRINTHSGDDEHLEGLPEKTKGINKSTHAKIGC